MVCGDGVGGIFRKFHAMAEFKLFSIRQDSTIVAVDVLGASLPVMKSFGQRTCKHESRHHVVFLMENREVS